LGVDKGVALAPTYPQVQWEIHTYVVLYVWMFVVLHHFMFFERLFLIAKKKSFKALDLETIF